jgi:putative endonuclease
MAFQLTVMYYVYIIESVTTGRWYYGLSSDLVNRLDGHNTGLNKSTAKRGPWRYIFLRHFDNKSDARVFEIYLKKTRNKIYIRSEFSEFFLNVD